MGAGFMLCVASSAALVCSLFMERPACFGEAGLRHSASPSRALPGYGGLRPDERRDESPSRVVESLYSVICHPPSVAELLRRTGHGDQATLVPPAATHRGECLPRSIVKDGLMLRGLLSSRSFDILRTLRGSAIKSVLPKVTLNVNMDFLGPRTEGRMEVEVPCY